ncbi:Npun_R2821/Npun_R2822 family protein [Leptolyngbya sp. FACHB-261]|uniref:Npun_R2821/Npun_R2822 family protein n=1 Tax=Leptolyngbya sp. FACHB-261 TaxID=2692806 RepID=UPI001682A3EB|nr:Npun_R2821/Npun_R2822 family protein [Leptolyngbya sp. FACHB-261]MBD2099526.1 methionine synthase [Leptolyngbya sp. FACHB-261]
MSRGIYITANNRVLDNAIALLNSIRLYDPEIPVILIPFNDDYQLIAETLAEQHGVQVYPDLEFLDRFTQVVAETFDRDFLALPNKMRKLVAWFGPLDEFLYIDTDIIVFEKIADNLNHLSEYGFLCCDFHHSGEKLKDVFAPLVKEQGIFTDAQLQDVFNSGFWASKKGTITEQQMYEVLRECAQHREYFDFSHGTTDQPVMNYMVLKLIEKRFNLVRIPGGGPGNWAGSKHFEEKDHILYDRGKRLQYLHWAGSPMRPGGPYRELWEHYRYLREPKPPTPTKPSSLQQLVNRLFPFMTARASS